MLLRFFSEQVYVLKLCSSLTDLNVLEILSRQVNQFPLLPHILCSKKRRNVSSRQCLVVHFLQFSLLQEAKIKLT